MLLLKLSIVTYKFTKRVVLLMPMPDTDIDKTASLLKLRSSNSRYNVAVNWLTTRRVQLQIGLLVQ